MYPVCLGAKQSQERRFLFDENMPRLVVGALRDAGFDAAWILEIRPGSTDLEVWNLAKIEGRICVTADKDFGIIAKSSGIAPPAGVVLLRGRIERTKEWADWLADLLLSRADLAGHFTVIDDKGIRVRSFNSEP